MYEREGTPPQVNLLCRHVPRIMLTGNHIDDSSFFILLFDSTKKSIYVPVFPMFFHGCFYFLGAFFLDKLLDLSCNDFASDMAPLCALWIHLRDVVPHSLYTYFCHKCRSEKEA